MCLSDTTQGARINGQPPLWLWHWGRWRDYDRFPVPGDTCHANASRASCTCWMSWCRVSGFSFNSKRAFSVVCELRPACRCVIMASVLVLEFKTSLIRFMCQDQQKPKNPALPCEVAGPADVFRWTASEASLVVGVVCTLVFAVCGCELLWFLQSLQTHPIKKINRCPTTTVNIVSAL